MGISALLASQILDASATGRSVLTGADASAIRSTLGLGTLATQSPTGTPSASTFLRGDFSWQTIDLSGYVPYTGATGSVNLGSNSLTASKLIVDQGTSGAASTSIRNQTFPEFGLSFHNNNKFSLSRSSTTLWETGQTGPEGYFTLGGTACLAFSSSSTFANLGSGDLQLHRDSSDTLAQRRTTNAQTFRVYNTFTDSSNYERAKIAWESNVLRIGTEKAGTGSARALELQTDGVSRLLFTSDGSILFSGTSAADYGILSAQSQRLIWGRKSVNTACLSQDLANGHLTFIRNAILSWSGSTSSSEGGGTTAAILSNAAGIIEFNGGSNSTLTLLRVGGATSSFPAIKRNSAALNFRLADDSADCDITAAHGTFSAGTDTTSNPILNLSQTWNNAATTFTGILANVTDTASNANSLLMDLQVGGTSRLQLDKSNNFRIGVTSSFAPFHLKTLSSSAFFAIQPGIGSISGIYFGDSSGDFTHRILKQGFDQDYTVVGTMSFRTGSPSTNRFSIDGNGLAVFTGTVEQRNSTNAQTFRIYNTFTDASNYERAKLAWESNVLRIGTEKAGTGSARALELQTDGTTRLTIGTTSGTIASLTNLFIDVTTYFASTTLANSRVAIGNGVTVGSAFQFLFSSTTGANGTADTGLARSAAGKVVITNGSTGSGSLVFRDAGDMEFGTTTGTKIGTATTQKLGFYNATPVVQPTAVADATDAASVITQLNALLSRMRDLGLIAT